MSVYRVMRVFLWIVHALSYSGADPGVRVGDGVASTNHPPPLAFSSYFSVIIVYSKVCCYENVKMRKRPWLENRPLSYNNNNNNNMGIMNSTICNMVSSIIWEICRNPTAYTCRCWN